MLTTDEREDRAMMGVPPSPVPPRRLRLWRLRVGGGWLAGVAIICVEIAVPARDPNSAFVIAAEMTWVAFLVISDAYLLMRRRRVVRPDYVAFAVAVCAGSYWIAQPVAWASFTGLGLAVVSAAFATSLRLQRNQWAVQRTRLAASLDQSVGPVAHATEDE